MLFPQVVVFKICFENCETVSSKSHRERVMQDAQTILEPLRVFCVRRVDVVQPSLLRGVKKNRSKGEEGGEG